MDAAMDKIGEMLLSQTAAKASGKSMPLPVDRRKATSSRVTSTLKPTTTLAAAPRPKPEQKTAVDSELEKIADMLLAQQTVASANGTSEACMPLPADRRMAAKPLDWGAKPL